MRSTFRRFLRYTLLATYAGISLLGEGLHLLTPEAGHHHHGLDVVHAAGGGVCRADHDADQHYTAAGAVLTAGECDVDSHACEVCAFLFQAVGQPVEVAAPLESQTLVVAAPGPLQRIYSPALLGPQAPRGPPLLG